MKTVWRIVKLLAWLVVIAAIVYGGQKLYGVIRRDYLYPLKYERFVEAYAAEYGLEEALVYGVIKTESDFDPHATSSAGAVGLMQLMPSTYEYLCTLSGEGCDEAKLLDPETNIRYGCMQLNRMQNRFGEGEAMLAAYNAGEGTVAGWLSDPAYAKDGKLTSIPYPETAEYVKRVQEAKNMYQTLYGEEQEWN